MDPDDLLKQDLSPEDREGLVTLEVARLLGELSASASPADRLALANRCAELLARCGDAALDVVSEQILKTCKVTKKSLREQIERVRSSERESQAQEPEPTMTPEEREEALALLSDADLLQRFVRDTELLGAIGEEENKILLLLTGTSRLLDEPISLVLKSSSSAGKSHLVDIVASTIPPESRNIFTSASGKAFFHLTKSLAHTLLVLVEHNGTEEAEYSIRVLQSEKKIIYAVPQKNILTGQIETVEKCIEGPIAYIETTTRPSLHAENETRAFSISIDEGEDFTRRILRRQAARAAGYANDDPEPIRRRWQNVQRLLEPSRVVIPCAPLLAEVFPTTRIRARRDYPRLLAIIEASALLHQRQRRRQDTGEVIADLQDYEVARIVAGRALRHAFRGTTEKTEKLIEAAWQLAQQRKASTPESCDLTVAMLREALPASGWSRDSVDRYAKQACEAGYLERTEGGRGKASVYQVRLTLAESGSSLPTATELAERMRGSAVPQTSAKDVAELNSKQEKDLSQPPQFRTEGEQGGVPLTPPCDEGDEESGMVAGG